MRGVYVLHAAPSGTFSIRGPSGVTIALQMFSSAYGALQFRDFNTTLLILFYFDEDLDRVSQRFC